MGGAGTAVVKGLVPWADMCASFDRSAARFVELLRSLEPADGERPVPGMDWTVAETAAHLIAILNRGLRDRRRGATLDEMHELNAQCIDEVETRDLRQIADRIEADAAAGQAVRAAARGDEPFPLHAGVVAEVSAALSYALWDLLVHGFDIANACGRDWPTPPEDASRVIRAGLPAVYPWVRPEVLDGAARRLAFALEPGGETVELSVGEGEYRVAVGPPDAGHGAPLDPVHMLLAISGRVPPRDDPTRELASWYLPI